MGTVRELKRKAAPTVETVEESNGTPIPEPGVLAAHYVQAARSVMNTFTPAYDTLKHVKPDLGKEIERLETVVAQRPQWNFSSTGQSYPMSRQLLRLTSQGVHSVSAYCAAVGQANHLLEESALLLPRAELALAKRREEATHVADVEMLETYFIQFQKMKAERMKLQTTVMDASKKLPDAIARGTVIRLLRATVAVIHRIDLDQLTARLVQKRAEVDAIRAANYPIDDEIGSLADFARPLLAETQEPLRFPRLIWAANEDPFAPPELED